MRFPWARGLVLAAACAFFGSIAEAQIYETFGTRAKGMGGAFVAVVDDATATWWNPAGLASGTLFSAVTERGRSTEPAEVGTAGPAGRDETTGFAVLYPALALSYYRLRISEIAPAATSTGERDPGRQDEGPAGVAQRSLAMSQYGVTIGQSLGTHVVLASTFRLIRGGSALGSTNVAAGEAALDEAADFDVPTDTHPDLDLGAMVKIGLARFAVSATHVREPTFGEGATAFVLERQVRAGFAVVTGQMGALNAIVAAVDADLTKTATVLGDVRHIGAGAEVWLGGRRLGLRGGVSSNIADSATTSTSFGVSLGIRSGFFLDGAVSVGSDRSRQGWATGVRVGF